VVLQPNNNKEKQRENIREYNKIIPIYYLTSPCY